MYAHSLVWLGLMIAAAVSLYRRIELEARLALGAALLFSVDPAHGPAVGWLSSRNTLIATLFGLCAISAWAKGSRAVSLLCIVVSLLCGEVGVCALAISVATPGFWIRDQRGSGYSAWFRCCSSRWPGARSTLPPASAHAARAPTSTRSTTALPFSRRFPAASSAASERYQSGSGRFVVRRRSGARGRCPGRRSYRFARLRLCRASAPPRRSDRAVLGLWFAAGRPAPKRRAAERPRPLLRGARPQCADRAARARIFEIRTGKVRFRPTRRRTCHHVVGWHALGRPIVLAMRSGEIQTLGRSMAGADRVLDSVPELERRTVVVLNPPRDIFASYVQLERKVRGASVARHWYWLSSVSSTLTVQRVAVDVLELRREGGFFSTPLERLYRRDPTALGPGQPSLSAAFEPRSLPARATDCQRRCASTFEPHSSTIPSCSWRGAKVATSAWHRLGSVRPSASSGSPWNGCSDLEQTLRTRRNSRSRTTF